MRYPLPQPIYDNIEFLIDQIVPSGIKLAAATLDFEVAKSFLLQYKGNQTTFNSYRQELERLTQWAWLIAEKPLLELRRADVESYLEFCRNPPPSWVGTSFVAKFVTKDGERRPNPPWRPFVSQKAKNREEYMLSDKAMQLIFAVLNSFYKHLIYEGISEINPVAAIRQKSKFVRKRQTKQIRKLSSTQWHYVLTTAEELANKDPTRHERTLFVMSALYFLYLRISELVASERWQPQMGHFYRDANNDWWFMTVGKGNKQRIIAVGEEMLAALKRYRSSRKLSPLPYPNEATPLVHKFIGAGNVASTQQIRLIVQHCFNVAIGRLAKDGLQEEAAALQQATVHWLRHTGISDDINKRHRPIAHVRDDAGHSSSAITDIYNDVNLRERHASKQQKE